jgi:single-strand DNA-binding protein
MANFNFNEVILGGRLTADPELKSTQNGTFVTSFSIAVNRAYQKERQTDFINIVAWKSTAEFICNFFKKGSSICVVGEIQTRSYNDGSGNKRYVTEVVARDARFVDGKNEVTASEEAPVYSINENIEFETIEADLDLPF